jgi:hypothetical protein
VDEAEWRERDAAHVSRTEAWTTPRLERRSRGIKHPVDDFMFDYYPYSPSRLTSWHPGHGIELRGDVRRFLQHPAYRRTDSGATTDIAHLAPKRDRLKLATRILKGTTARAPQLGCFGMHEWAMVYGLEQEQVRHEALPLRLSPAEIKDAVDGVGLRCTHIDAFRFFTDEATSLNSLTPTRATQPDLEQPGCLHAAMDLYKYAQWFHPFISSELTADCFENARRARELDMRASPYDVTSFELAPIRVETPDGRREYVEEQRALMETTEPLRARVLTVLTDLLRTSETITHTTPSAQGASA